MNSTNRAVNRGILAVLGLMLLLTGTAVVAIATWPRAASAWTAAGESARAWVGSARERTPIAGTTVAWVDVAAVGILAAVIALLVVTMIRTIPSRRRAPVAVTGAQSDLGRVTVTDGLASDALKAALGDRAEILSVRVTTNRVARESVLHVRITPRQNASPLHIAETTDRMVSNLAVLTGRDLPTYISIHSGLRARLASDDRGLR